MFCNKCGAQFEEGTAFCQQCGNDLNAAVAVKEEEAAPTPVSPVPTPAVPVKKDKKKLVLIIIAAVVAVALIVVGAIFIPKTMKEKKAKELEKSLVGEEFCYTERMTYSYIETEFTFEENSRCKMYKYYSALGSGHTLHWDYKIKYISKDEIILCIGYNDGDTFDTTYEYAVNVNSDGDAVRSFTEIDNEDALFE